MERIQDDFDSLIVYGNPTEHGDSLGINCSLQLTYTHGCTDVCADSLLAAKGTQDAPDLQNHEFSYFIICYEPIRRMVTPAPPKRFFRTFWRSVARRLMERESTRLSKEVNITAV